MIISKPEIIPTDFVLNFDQTPVLYITVGNKTLEFEGAISIFVKVKLKSKTNYRDIYCLSK